MDGTSSTLPFADGDGRDESGVSGTALPPTKEFTRADRAKTAIFLRRADELCANWADYVACGGQYGPEWLDRVLRALPSAVRVPRSNGEARAGRR
jgi:hypothetical protein